MTTVIIDEKTPQGEYYLQYTRTLPFATVIEEQNQTFDEAVEECNGIDSKAFFAEVRRRINEQYDRIESA